MLDKDNLKSKVIESGMFPVDRFDKISTDIDDYVEKLKDLTDGLTDSDIEKVDFTHKKTTRSNVKESSIKERLKNELLCIPEIQFRLTHQYISSTI